MVALIAHAHHQLSVVFARNFFHKRIAIDNLARLSGEYVEDFDLIGRVPDVGHVPVVLRQSFAPALIIRDHRLNKRVRMIRRIAVDPEIHSLLLQEAIFLFHRRRVLFSDPFGLFSFRFLGYCRLRDLLFDLHLKCL